MPYLSRMDIENIGKQVIGSYEQIAGEQEKIDISFLAQEVLGLKIEYHRLSENGDILGMTSFCEIGVEVYDQQPKVDYVDLDGKTILIDESLIADQANIGRRNFTIAHETSHHILKMMYPSDYGVRYRKTAEKMYRQTGYERRPADWDEWQADALASVLLLPEKYVREAMQRYNLGEKMFRLNRVFASKEYDQFSAMAEFLGASKTALSIRMQNLHLLKENYLGRPYDLVSVTVDQEEEEWM